MSAPIPLFVPDPATANASQIASFRELVGKRTGRLPENYGALQAFAIGEPAAFWTLWLESSGMVTVGDASPAITEGDIEHAEFFPNLQMNFAENLLRDAATAPALSWYDETGLCGRLSRGDLLGRVLRMAGAFRDAGVVPGDRVVGIVRNAGESIVACLGAAAVGAAWSSVSPDLGTAAILSRFEQLTPVALCAHGSYQHHGARRDLREQLTRILAALPSLKAMIALDEAAELPDSPTRVVRYADAIEGNPLPAFPMLPFNHPLYILFSSGTTGAPKCIVHGAGGTLIEHLKEHRLHCNLGSGDRLYFHTTAGWMMWNWQLSALATGCEIILYDGSVSYPEPDSLLRLLEKAGATHFGTSPAYLQYLRDSGIKPRERFKLDSLRAILSTGSVLPAALFEWTDLEFKHVPLQSISGGTDIIGCFVLGNPELPVYAGESQCVSLGYDVRVGGEGGIRQQGRGELLCCGPFPSRPIGFFGDIAGDRFHEAYFCQNAPWWTHGDLLELTSRGTAQVLGRTDGTLNIRGVRIGPAEVTSVAQNVPGVRQAMAIEQVAPREPGGSRMVLLVVLADGVALDRPLQLRIKRELATRASANHVPAVIADVPELPSTFSGKLSERAARDAVNGVAAANLAALRNPKTVDQIRAHPAVLLSS